MTFGGYAGQILYIDLSSGIIKTESLNKNFAQQYIGGLGFTTRIYFDLIKNHSSFDALSADNPIIIMTGPLTGIKLHATARWTVGAKSPLTGFWGDSNIGGFFGAELKFAGYDGIVITGASPEPVYIFIDSETVEIRDAKKYWGKDVYTVTDEFTSDLKQDSKKSGQVFTIGPAGEKLVRFASIINNKGHVAGRTGMGAVFGSKKLKAIYVQGDNEIKIAHPEIFKAIRSEINTIYKDHITIEALRTYGTASHMDVGIISGDIPMKNWQQSDWEQFEQLSPIAYSEQILTGHRTCYGCGVACKREAEVKDGLFKFSKGPGPEYETIAAFGTMCLNPNLKAIGKANDLCNRYGMDTITCGASIAFAMECFEHGLISKKDTDGLDITWGNAEAIVALVEKIGNRQGFGAILAEGSEKASTLIGGNAHEFLTTVKGLESPMHDPRAFHGFGLAYAVSPRGACHMASLNYPIEGGGMYLPEIPELADEIDGMTSQRKAEINIACQDFGMFFSHCAIFCNLGAMILNASQAVQIVNSVTGFTYTIPEVMKLGKRVWFLKRGISNIFGSRACHDRLPKRLLSPLDHGPTQESIPNIEQMLNEFYQLRGLNEHGIPHRHVLDELGLTDLADMIGAE